MISITVMIKDGGCEQTQIPIRLIGQLAKTIKAKGYEYIHTASGKTFEVVGFLVSGEQIGKRVIMLGTEDEHETVQR